MFNLAWALAGGPAPLANYAPHAGTTLWVMERAPAVVYKRQSLPDAALAMSLPKFLAWLRSARLPLDPTVTLLRSELMALDCLRAGDA